MVKPMICDVLFPFSFYFRYRCYYLMLLFILFSLCCKHNLFVCIDVMMQTMLFSELPHVHRCYSAGHYNPCCTVVIVQGHYLFIFSSGMDCNNPSHRCGRLYFPIFLFNVGLFTLIYMASFIALAMLWSSLPIILKISTDVMWPVLSWCSCIGHGAFRCSLYLSSKVLDDSHMYFSLQSILSHLNQYMTLLFFLMLSSSLPDTSKFLIVFPSLKIVQGKK